MKSEIWLLFKQTLNLLENKIYVQSCIEYRNCDEIFLSDFNHEIRNKNIKNFINEINNQKVEE